MGASHSRAETARPGRTIGVVAPMVGGFYFGAIIAGITRAAARADMRVVAVQSFPTRLARERQAAAPLPGDPACLDAMDAVVVVTEALEPDRLADLIGSGKPLVLVGADEDAGAPVLRPDNPGGARAAVDHLVAHGHQRIGFVGDLSQGDIRARHEGWLAALTAHGIAPQDDWFHLAPGNTVPGGADAAEASLRAGSPTTAVLAATDLAAIGFIRGLQRSGAVVPRDVAVIGFDHTEGGSRLTPRLATVDPHHDRVGELAVAHLVAQLRGEAAPGTHVPTTLVVRESCGCERADTVGPPPPGDGTPGAVELRRLATAAFAGPGGAVPRGVRTAPDLATAWADAVLAVVDAAAERGTPPSAATLRRLRDLTAALGPYPETLEQCVAAVRTLEDEVSGLLPEGPRRAAHRRAVTDVLLALTQGCLRPSLAREAAMERGLAEQYEVDVDVATARGGPRSLTWLPNSGRTSACLGLWTGRTTPSGGREIEVVGALARSGTLARSIGRTVPAAQFPPASLLRAEPLDGSTLVFVVPVTSAERDWGLLAVTGRLDPRMLHSRERHQHWGALLALALDEEQRRHEQDERLAQLEATNADREAAAAELAAEGQRHTLWLDALRHAVWDWDVARGSVHWTPQWAALLGLDRSELTDSPTEWLDRVHPEDRVALSALVAAQLGGSRERLRMEHRVRHASGEYRWLLCEAVTLMDDTGAPARLLGAFVDVTERKHRELALVTGVLRDPGTGLPNRASYLDRLSTIVERSHRSGTDAAVAVLRAVAQDDVAALGQRLEAAALHCDVVGHLWEDTLACAFVDRPDQSGAARLASVLDDLPAQQRRLVAVGMLPSVRAFDDAADAMRAAEAIAARDVPGVAR